MDHIKKIPKLSFPLNSTFCIFFLQKFKSWKVKSMLPKYRKQQEW
jgi:hypothetical protein